VKILIWCLLKLQIIVKDTNFQFSGALNNVPAELLLPNAHFLDLSEEALIFANLSHPVWAINWNQAGLGFINCCIAPYIIVWYIPLQDVIE
jgi:hypothetical protein